MIDIGSKQELRFMCTTPLIAGDILILKNQVAVLSATPSAALALSPHEISANGIAPGVVDTPTWTKSMSTAAMG